MFRLVADDGCVEITRELGRAQCKLLAHLAEDCGEAEQPPCVVLDLPGVRASVLEVAVVWWCAPSRPPPRLWADPMDPMPRLRPRSSSQDVPGATDAFPGTPDSLLVGVAEAANFLECEELLDAALECLAWRLADQISSGRCAVDGALWSCNADLSEEQRHQLNKGMFI